ncbi:MAG TPA: proline--tRNA ligase [Solirubrobacteraceae bacterium]|jgi:prolyl-tRNA synthetase|nr:proline--tRNA ligase [Solirubrobacteraceae bacterium]
MTRLSQYLLPTEKQAPADAEAISHKLMVRAGLIRQLGAGMWTWLPAGWRAHQRAVQIIREEMDAIGGHELLMPVLQPAEPWRKSGRYAIDELFKLHDRKGSELVLAMTHEEAVTTHVAQTVRSYRDLPLILYHFQVKERDEPRPRAGVLRTREFIMKDAYSFDRDADGMDERYELHVGAYDRIMERTGLRWYRVQADVGMMGGTGAHEYMAPCPAGENEVALAGSGASQYAANVEVASAAPQPVELPPAPVAPEEVSTPGLTSVVEVAAALGVPEGALLKAYPVIVEDDGRMLLLLVRGDHRVNEIKLARVLGRPSRPARAEEIAARLGPPGFIGPVGLDGRVEILLDEAALPIGARIAGDIGTCRAHGEERSTVSGAPTEEGMIALGGAIGERGGYVTGANRPDAHLRGVVPGRDFPFRSCDVRAVCAGDTVGGVGGYPITIEPAIEIGNIFKLGTRYSEPLSARFLDESGREQAIWMGCYGIGPARIAAAAVEQYADERGISWPRALAPFQVHLVAVGKAGDPARAKAEELYETLRAGGVEVVYDDRDAGPGEKFADAELLGCPLRLTVGKRAIESGEIEVQVRRGRRDAPGISLAGPPGELIRVLDELCRTLP